MACRPVLALCAVATSCLAGCRAAQPVPTPPPPLIQEAPAEQRLTFDDAITLRNAHVRVSVSPRVGRVVEFGPVDGGNLLWIGTPAVYGNPAKGPAGRLYYNLGGDKLWPTVQSLWERAYGANWPPDGVIDGMAWRLVERSDRRIVIESEVSPYLGVQIRRAIELAEDAPALSIVNTTSRVEPNVFPVTNWTVTQIAVPPHALLDISPQRPDVSSLWIAIGNPAVAAAHATVIGNEAAVAIDTSHDGAIKAGTLGEWVAAAYKEVVFLQTTDYDPRGAYPDASSAQVYSDNDYIELELLSPFVHLQPGESLTNRVTWRLLPREPGSTLEEVRRQIEAAVRESDAAR